MNIAMEQQWKFNIFSMHDKAQAVTEPYFPSSIFKGFAAKKISVHCKSLAAGNQKQGSGCKPYQFITAWLSDQNYLHPKQNWF